jgi:hypothetical protein
MSIRVVGVTRSAVHTRHSQPFVPSRRLPSRPMNAKRGEQEDTSLSNGSTKSIIRERTIDCVLSWKERNSILQAQ